MKKLIALLTAFTLLLVCSCAAQNEPETTETSAPAAIPATPTEAAVTEISYDFRLEELPDIGAYSHSEPKYYYGAPLNDFRTSDEYGTVIPYLLRETEVGDAPDVCNCGFMTTDGRIITGPVYDRVEQVTAGEQTFYLAEKKLLNTGNRAPDYRADMTDEEREAWGEEWKQARDQVIKNRVIQLISEDGSRCGSFHSNAYVYTDKHSGKSVIVNSGMSDGHKTLTVYDTDFRQIIDLSEPLREYLDTFSSYGADATGVRLIGADDTGLAVLVVYDQPDASSDSSSLVNKLYLTEGGTISATVTFETADVYSLFGDWVVCHDGVYDLNGVKRYAIPSFNDSLLHDPLTDAVYMTDTGKGLLRRMDRSGQWTEKSVAPADSMDVESVKSDDGKVYLLVTGRTDDQKSVTVFDSALRQVNSIPYNEDAQTTSVVNYSSHDGFCYTVADGVTRLYGWTGALLAEIPAEISSCSYYSHDVPLLEDGEGRSFLYLSERRSVIEVPRQTTGNYCDVDYLDENVFTVTEYDNGRINSLYSPAENALITDDLQGFLAVTAGGKHYYAYVDGSTAYVRDASWNVLLKAYDNTFV